MRPILLRQARLGRGRHGALAVGLLASAGVWAQPAAAPDPAVGRTFTIVPTFSITQTLTDNSRLVSSGLQSDLITQISPGIRVSSTGGRFKGFLDYAMTGVVYARNSGRNDIQNKLNARFNLEAVENWAFLDTSASIAQQSISAYGTRSADSSAINANRTEVRNLSVSPYVKGYLANFADYEARFTQSWSRSSESAEADHANSVAAIRVAGDSAWRLLRWSADATRQVIDYSEGRRTENDRLRGSLLIAVDPQLRLSLIGGHESNNYVSLDKEGRTTTGWGVDWMPTDRTRVSAQRERRFFGNSHAYMFEHRMPRSVWTFSDNRDISTGLGQSAPGSLGTAYDLLFTQFASLQPDPTLRAKLVSDFLQTNGIQPSAQIFTPSQASAATLQRQQALSFVLLGIRDTVTFTALRSEARRLDAVSVVADDFANGNQVRQRGFSVGLAHRLTPLSALNLVAALDRTSGTATAQESRLRSILLGWTGRLGPRSTATLSARHSKFDGTSEPYSESAIVAAINLQF
ncbi:MAG: TIGR03016 family PEP-CTERM system-associated outer membrane protein [Variovorax sp.]|nr:TIGR03016 family PEP-CTERM system-associated outer membrane protein [Variovorax sp.]